MAQTYTPQVYEASRWSQFQWKEHMHADADARSVVAEGEAQIVSWPDFCAEVFHRLYHAEAEQDVLPPEKQKPEHTWARKFHSQMGLIPDFNSLKEACQGDAFGAGVAARAFLEVCHQRLPSPDPQLKKDADKLRQQTKALKHHRALLAQQGIVDPNLDHAIADLVEEGKKTIAIAMKYADDLDDSTIRVVIREACELAAQAHANAQEEVTPFLYGDGDGNPYMEQDASVKRQLTQTLAGNSRLRAIAHLAGRLQRSALHKQRTKVNPEREEVVGVDVGNDLEHLLPTELLKLSRPELFPLFAKSYFERSLLQYEMAGKDKEVRGPIVVCVDISDSMAGDRDIWARAVAMAVLSVARFQHRDARIILFNNEVQKVCDFYAKESVDMGALINLLLIGPRGGTNFELPLAVAQQAIGKNPAYKKADVIFITDGHCYVSEGFEREFAQHKQDMSFVVFGIVIGKEITLGLEQFSDHTYSIADVMRDAENEATDTIFSI